MFCQLFFDKVAKAIQGGGGEIINLSTNDAGEIGHSYAKHTHTHTHKPTKNQNFNTYLTPHKKTNKTTQKTSKALQKQTNSKWIQI